MSIRVERPQPEDVEREILVNADRVPDPVPPSPDDATRVVPFTGEAPRNRAESLVVLVAFWIAFGLIGYRVVIEQHVIVFEALDRLARAYFVWHNDPPKLAAVGFGSPPFTSLIYLPFAIVKPLATSLIAIPVMSALMAAGTLVVVNRLMTALDIGALLRLPLLIAFALNPMFVFYASNGMAEAFYLLTLAIALYCFVEWYLSEEPRFLIGAGMALSIALLTRYSLGIWAFFMALTIGLALQRRGARGDEVEGSTIAFLAPVVYALALWILFNLLIVGSPFGWLTDQEAVVAVNSASAMPADLSWGDVVGRVLQVHAGLFPLAFAAFAALVIAFAVQRNDMALWLAVFIALSMVVVGVNAYGQQEQGLLKLRDAMPAGLAALVGAAWLMYSFSGLRLVVWGVSLAVLVVGIVSSWSLMRTYPFQNQEQAFVRALETGADQEGSSSIGGYNVGIRPEQRMAAYIKRNVEQGETILTDNAQTFGVILLTGRPELFFDRVDRGDARWRSALADPYGRVDYVLVASDSAGDEVRRVYPTAASTGVPGFQQAFKTPRYLLLSVTETDPRPAAERRRRAEPPSATPGTATPFEAP